MQHSSSPSEDVFSTTGSDKVWPIISGSHREVQVRSKSVEEGTHVPRSARSPGVQRALEGVEGEKGGRV